MSNSYKCPNCGLELLQQQAARSFSCENNHNFDLAKEGYLNLHLAQHKRSRNPGDSDEMIRSRQRFLNTGHYNFWPKVSSSNSAICPANSGFWI